MSDQNSVAQSNSKRTRIRNKSPEKPAATTPHAAVATEGTNPVGATPLTAPREPVPPVVGSRRSLLSIVPKFAYGTGPVAADTERASGTRYGQATYLIQLRRAGAGTVLIDPLALPDLSSLQLAIDDAEYIIHAASQDLAGLREHGLNPVKLFDTELAGRLLGYPRVALGVLTSEILGYELAKEHSAEDWSKRPLPSSWLRYAALDVELLIELRNALALKLEAEGKMEWALQEFDHVLHMPLATPHPEPWRRTIGLGAIRNPRQLAIARSLWEAREALAKSRDIAPKRILSDRAIVAAAWEMPANAGRLMAIREFSDPATRRRARTWQAAIDAALALPDGELPTSRGPGTGGPPNTREWERRKPDAAARLADAKAILAELSEQLNIPAENILLPDTLKRLCWEPPRQSTTATIAAALANYQARPWQIDLLTTPLAKAFKRK